MAGAVSQRPQFFNFDAQAVRIIGSPGEPWFVAKDVCAVLELEKTDSALRGLEEDEKGAQIVSTLGGAQELSVINESGLYALIFRSRKPQAKLFRRWVTGEVLPAIRKTGTFTIPSRAPEVRRIEILHKLEPLPPVPDGESRAADLLWAAIGYFSTRRSLTARSIARTAVERGFYQELCTDTENHLHVARLMCRLARYFGTWVCAVRESGVYVSIAPEGKGRTRRYWITVREEAPLKPHIELRHEPITRQEDNR